MSIAIYYLIVLSVWFLSAYIIVIRLTRLSLYPRKGRIGRMFRQTGVLIAAFLILSFILLWFNYDFWNYILTPPEMDIIIRGTQV